MGLQVRAITEDDRAEWEVLWKAYLAFYQVDLAPEITDDVWRRALDPQASVRALVAVNEDDRTLQGFTHYHFQEVTWQVNERCYLEDLFVAEHARGSDAAQALIEAVKQAATDHGSDQVFWVTQESNYRARALYDRVAKNAGLIQYSIPLD